MFAGCYDEHGEGANKLIQLCSDRLRIIPIDVTKDDVIKRAFDLVKSSLPPNGRYRVLSRFLKITNVILCFLWMICALFCHYQ